MHTIGALNLTKQYFLLLPKCVQLLIRIVVRATLFFYETDVRVDGTPPTAFSSASAVNLNGEIYLYGGSTSQPQGFLYKVSREMMNKIV